MAFLPRRILRRPRNALVVIAAVGSFGVLSSSVGIGALPTTSLPVYGVTSGEGSRTTVAELGDVNGDGFTDYAVGKPYADANGTDSGIVYVFLGPGVTAPASLDVRNASFTITGHGGELLGFSVTGGDFNGDGRADIGIGAPMAMGPNRAGAGVVYTVFGTRTPRNVSTTELNYTGFTNDPVNPAPHSPIGSRYEGFQPNSHTGTAVAAMPDVNGDGYDEPRSACRTRACTGPAAAGRRCSTASPRVSTSISPTSGKPGIPTTSTSISRRSTISTSARRSRAFRT